MNPQDDPEERIRQLEQARAGQGAVELGATQPSVGVNPTTQLPPPAYPDPYATSPYSAPPFGTSYPQGPRKGAPIGLIFGLIAVAVVVATGVIGAVVWNMSSPAVSGPDSEVVGGGGSLDPGADVPGIDEPSGEFPNMEPMLPGSDSVTTAAPGERLSVAGVDGSKTIECNDSDISVSGVNNTVTITGHCASVTVSGVENQVRIDSADVISASGFDNRVIYHFGSPEINATRQNVVAQG